MVAFVKMKALCNLEERHGLEVGKRASNAVSCSTVVAFITDDLKLQLKDSLNKARLYIFQMDGTPAVQTSITHVE